MLNKTHSIDGYPVKVEYFYKKIGLYVGKAFKDGQWEKVMWTPYGRCTNRMRNEFDLI